MKIQSSSRFVPHVPPVRPAEFRKQVVQYTGKVGPIGSKMQAAVWSK